MLLFSSMDYSIIFNVIFIFIDIDKILIFGIGIYIIKSI